MKNVCVITTTRAEYGQLRWIINDIFADTDLNLQLVVSGGHLSPEQGLTYHEIENDGYPINDKIEMCLSTVTDVGIVKSMGILMLSICETFNRSKPDIIVLLGDRYELLPIASAALIMKIPIAHIGGGDLTMGAIDNEVRNAVTMMSTLHFASTTICADRIRTMIHSKNNIFVTGDRSLDNYNRMSMMDREALSSSLGIDKDKKWILLTYHPETKISVSENIHNIYVLMDFLKKECADHEIIITKANTDLGGVEINQYLESCVAQNPNMHLFHSLGQLRYSSICFQLEFMIGNSSSGIYESGYCKLPTINVGHRQDGRYLTDNIVSSEITYNDLTMALDKIKNPAFIDSLKDMVNPYGNGDSSKIIVSQIKKYLLKDE